MKTIEFSVTSKLHIFPTFPQWTFIPIPSEKIPKVKKLGWSSVPVLVTLGNTKWRTSIFPLGEGKHFLPIKKEVCKKNGIMVGDEITVKYIPVI